MTPAQKNYFAWLVLKNTETIARRAVGSSAGTALINKAFEKFKALGIPVQSKSSMAMRRESIAILGRLLGVRLCTVVERQHLVDQYEEDFDIDEPF